MFATFVCGPAAGSPQAQYMFGVGWGSTDSSYTTAGQVRAGMKSSGCGAGFLDSLQGGDGLPALDHGVGSGCKCEPAQTSKLSIQAI